MLSRELGLSRERNGGRFSTPGAGTDLSQRAEIGHGLGEGKRRGKKKKRQRRERVEAEERGSDLCFPQNQNRIREGDDKGGRGKQAKGNERDERGKEAMHLRRLGLELELELDLY